MIDFRVDTNIVHIALAYGVWMHTCMYTAQ